MTQSGVDDYVYQEVFDWARLPEGWDIGEVVDVAVDEDDRVYIFSRAEHPLMVFEQDGSFIRAWGEGLFRRPHGLTLAEDELLGAVLYCVDDDGHWIGKFTLDGELLTALGKRGESTPRMSGQPFNRPTKVAIDPKSGELYISDGCGSRYRAHNSALGVAMRMRADSHRSEGVAQPPIGG